MNIFFLSISPEAAACMLCDKHIVKMILETCQLLWAAYHLQPETATAPPESIKIYKLTHANHPMSKWIRHSRENFNWAARHALAACGEYTVRYGRRHACEPGIRWLADGAAVSFANQTYLATTILASFDYPLECSPPPICIADRNHLAISCRGGVTGYSLVQSYRNYYRAEKARFARWSRSPTPQWFKGRVIIE